MSKIGLIISREYITRVRKKSFILMSFLGPLLIVGFGLFTAYLSSAEKEKYEILVVDESHLFDSILRNSQKYHLQWAPKDKSYTEIFDFEINTNYLSETQIKKIISRKKINSL